MNPKPIIKPILNDLPFLYDILRLGTKGSDSARYCYSVWLRHLVRASEAGFDLPRTLAELGPGDSLGVGLAGMLTGVDRYFALDVKAYAETKRNREIFDELAGYFRSRTDIPHDEEFPDVHPKLSSYDFPETVVTSQILEHSLRDERLRAIRELIAQPGDDHGLELAYKAPWQDQGVIRPNAVDMIVAQAVMEHVDRPEETYASLYRWLRSGGVFSQDIDFRSHNTAWSWNGHYRAPAWLWCLIRGRREWGINRLPLSGHLSLMEQAGFEIITVEPVKREDGISRERLAKEFQDISDDDLYTAQAYVLARKA